MAKASLFLKTDKPANKRGLFAVFIRFSHAGTRAFFQTHVFLKESDVNKNNKRFRVHAKMQGASEINIDLEGLEAMADTVINKFKRDPQAGITAEFFKNAFEQKYRPCKTVIEEKKIYDWVALFDNWTKNCGRSQGTTKGYLSAKNCFLNFIDGEIVPIESISVALLDRWVVWCFDVKKFEAAYITNLVNDFRLFLKKMYKVEKNKYNVDSDVLLFKADRPMRIHKKPAIFLLASEAEILQAFKPETEALERVKDVYLLMHYTGLRPSDRYIDKSEVIEYTDKKGGVKRRIQKVMQKTDETAIIPVTTRLQSILDKYDYQIPALANQPFNRALKELFRLAGIDRKVKVITYPGGVRNEVIKELWEVASAKIGRKSLVSRLISLDVSIKKIGTITGHKKPINTEPYAGVVESDLDDAMQRAFGE